MLLAVALACAPTPNGFAATCNTSADCPEGLICVEILEGSAGACSLTCELDADCPWGGCGGFQRWSTCDDGVCSVDECE